MFIGVLILYIQGAAKTISLVFSAYAWNFKVKFSWYLCSSYNLYAHNTFSGISLQALSVCAVYHLSKCCMYGLSALPLAVMLFSLSNCLLIWLPGFPGCRGLPASGIHVPDSIHW